MTTLVRTSRTALSKATWRQSHLSVATAAVGRRAFSAEKGTDDATPARRLWSTPGILNPKRGHLDNLSEPSSGSLKWYSCGPTVYDSAHLGHARTYVSLDIIRRILVDHFHFDVTYALGVTDVDDKIIARARERGLTRWPEIAVMAGEFEKEFMKDMDDLGVRRPDAVARVTEHLPDIIAYIQRIIENGMAYEAEGGIYFDVEKMGSDYGKLGIGGTDSTTPVEGQEDGESDARGKRSHKDFALWKKAKPDEPWWDAPFGRGRPGWHIECSAMTHSLFGQHLDIHSGGIDLKFPHHTNEIAQCEAYCFDGESGAAQGDNASARVGLDGSGRPWVQHWIHTGHLHIEGRKMSKSLKNFVTVREYLDGHAEGRRAAAEDFRMFCLMHKYSSSVTLSEDRMEEARIIRGRMERFLGMADTVLRGATTDQSESSRRWGDKEKWLQEEISACRRGVHLALSEDFDTPKVVRHLATLCAITSTHMNSETMGDAGPVRAAAKCVSDTLGMLGVGSSKSSASASHGVGERLWDEGSEHEGGGDKGGTGGLPPSREVIAAIVEVRRAMRHLVLARNLSSPNCMHEAKQMKRDLLGLADRTRDETLRNMGVHVDDGPNNTCTWMLLPPQRHRGGYASPAGDTGLLAKPNPVSGGSRVDAEGGGGSKGVPPPWVKGLERQEKDDREKQ